MGMGGSPLLLGLTTMCLEVYSKCLSGSEGFYHRFDLSESKDIPHYVCFKGKYGLSREFLFSLMSRCIHSSFSLTVFPSPNKPSDKIPVTLNCYSVRLILCYER